MTFFLFTSPILPKCRYLMKHWTEFSHIQSECSATGALSNLCDWAIQDGRQLLLLKIQKHENDNNLWMNSDQYCVTKDLAWSYYNFSQIDHPKWLPLPALKIAKNKIQTMSHELPNEFIKASVWHVFWLQFLFSALRIKARFHFEASTRISIRNTQILHCVLW